MEAFLVSFLGYVRGVIKYAVLAVAGIVIGKKLRENKDAKTSTVRIQSGRK